MKRLAGWATGIALLACGYWFFGSHYDQLWAACGLAVCNVIAALPILAALEHW